MYLFPAHIIPAAIDTDSRMKIQTTEYWTMVSKIVILAVFAFRMALNSGPLISLTKVFGNKNSNNKHMFGSNPNDSTAPMIVASSRNSFFSKSTLIRFAKMNVISFLGEKLSSYIIVFMYELAFGEAQVSGDLWPVLDPCIRLVSTWLVSRLLR